VGPSCGGPEQPPPTGARVLLGPRGARPCESLGGQAPCSWILVPHASMGRWAFAGRCPVWPTGSCGGVSLYSCAFSVAASGEGPAVVSFWVWGVGGRVYLGVLWFSGGEGRRERERGREGEKGGERQTDITSGQPIWLFSWRVVTP
jgi:hypothetical protein